MTSFASNYDRDGYFLAEDVLAPEQVERLRDAIASIPNGTEVRRRGTIYGARHLLHQCPAVRDLARSSAIRQFVTPILGEHAFAVRATFFDKVPGANWSLFWHQDRVIAVRERIETAGFTGWSKKADIWQVQPPPEVLARMLAIRVHLDDCGEENGPLRVFPGSHRAGWLDETIGDWKDRVPEKVCLVRQGGIVGMCPLLLHASAASLRPDHRRVIHIEFAANDLPSGLGWHQRISPE